MKILIIGAGIAGMTLAALLHRQRLRPVVVERASLEHAGYMLGLWPMGSRVLHGLGLYDRFVDSSVEMNRYELRGGNGALIRRWSMDVITRRFGPLLSSTRPQLVQVLREGLGDLDVRFGIAAERVEQRDGEVRVALSDGSSDAYDLVVAADGIHSPVRRRLFRERRPFETGWGGWVWWTDTATIPDETVVEYWGTGRFLGAYPTRRGAGIFAGAPVDEEYGATGHGRRQRIRARFSGMGAQVDRMLDALPDDDATLFFWKLADARAVEWVSGRVVLLGDAAAGFLPTAGVGASMAMESAAVLADELSRTDVSRLEHALELYVKRRKRRVESIQTESRNLARLMFVRTAAVARVRNVAMRFYPLRQLVGSIAKALDEPI